MILKNNKINNNNIITFNILGMMKVGKSTFINSILGFPLSKAGLERETLVQSIFTYTDKKTDNNNIAKKIKIENDKLKLKKELKKIQEYNFNVHTKLFKELFNFKNCSWEIIDNVGFGENNKNNDKNNMKLLLKNTYYTDVYFFVTEPRKCFKQNEEVIILDKLLNDIKNKDIITKLVIIINRIDEIDEDDITKTVERCKEKINNIDPTIDLTIIPYSSKFVGLYRQFIKNNDINNLDNDNDIKKLIKQELGNNKKFVKLLDEKKLDILNKKLKDSIADNDWEKTFGYNKLKKYITELKTDDILYNQYNNMLKDTFSSSVKDNNNIFEEIMLKLKWTNTYKKNKHWNKIKNNFKTELFSLLNKLNVCYIDDNKIIKNYKNINSNNKSDIQLSPPSNIDSILQYTKLQYTKLELNKMKKNKLLELCEKNGLNINKKTKKNIINKLLEIQESVKSQKIFLNKKLNTFCNTTTNSIISNSISSQKLTLQKSNIKLSPPSDVDNILQYTSSIISNSISSEELTLQNLNRNNNSNIIEIYSNNNVKNDNTKNNNKDNNIFKLLNLTSNLYKNYNYEWFKNEWKDIIKIIISKIKFKNNSLENSESSFIYLNKIKENLYSIDNSNKTYNILFKKIFKNCIYINNKNNFSKVTNEEWENNKMEEIYNYYNIFINNLYNNKLLNISMKIELFELFFNTFASIYINNNNFTICIKKYMGIINSKSTIYLNKFFLYYTQKSLVHKYFDNPSQEFEHIYTILDTYYNLKKTEEQYKFLSTNKKYFKYIINYLPENIKNSLLQIIDFTYSLNNDISDIIINDDEKVIMNNILDLIELFDKDKYILNLILKNKNSINNIIKNIKKNKKLIEYTKKEIKIFLNFIENTIKNSNKKDIVKYI